MFSTSLRKALAIARNTSSASKESLDSSTEGTHNQRPDDSDTSFVLEEGVLAPSSSGGNRSLELPSTNKLLPGLPVQSTHNTSSSGNLPDGVPQYTYTNVTISLDVDRPPPPLDGETNVEDTHGHSSLHPKPQETATLRTRRSNAGFHPFLHKLAVISVTETEPTKSQTQPVASQDQPLTYAQPESFPSTQSTVVPSPNSTSPTSSSPSDADDQDKSRRRKRPQNTFAMLQPIVESGDSASFQPKPSSSSFAPSNLGLDSSFARRMEETGRLRRLQSQSSLNSGSTGSAPPVVPPSPVKTPTIPEKPVNGTAHLKAYSEGDQSPGPAPKNIPSPPPVTYPNGQSKDTDSQPEEQAVLQDLLDRTLRELKAAKEETARVKAQSDREKSRLVRQLNASHDTVTELEKENRDKNSKIFNLETRLQKTEQELKEVTQEKHGWQEQLDTMHHRLTKSERQVRSLDQLMRAKLEARQEGVFGPTKRSQNAPQIKQPSMEVISAVAALNEEILQAANQLVENLERVKTAPTTEDIARAKAVLGFKATVMMQVQASDRSKGFKFLLMQVVLEVFMVHWSTNIIEGHYPPQKSFADLLIEMSTRTTVTASLQGAQQIDCGKVKILQTDSNAIVTMKFPDWVVDLTKDLALILSIGGLRIRTNRSSLFTSKLLTLVKIAYDVRTALAEKDICGDLELSVVGPDMPFQTKWMEEAHAMSRNKVLATMQMEPIAGTSGMGLQRSTQPGETPVVVMKPKVVLARVLEESP
ncbi:hypothetical protein GALMADRAFT_212553 [Galerina marginata CBS 339.88]|uniref:Uncharacterized protein n=1 Tax=Galerina marginata (strain CBS 339.88) TaxID=685588 RepID=A0A067SS75_GALM3|nr:hypothetical protein GALMADRAFT_212553 [Galerina marginata CBS 339.88]